MDIIYANQEPVGQALDEAAEEINRCFEQSSYRDAEEKKEIIAGLFKN